jgi:glycosyltransferase involved in cell wall biosynthesis
MKILFINPGPKMSINEKYHRDLGKYCQGAMLTTSMDDKIRKLTRVADFEFRCAKFHFHHLLYSNLKFTLYCLMFALRKRMAGDKFDLVVTYDPIKTGLIGALAAKILGARFAPEVNGLYTSDAEYMDGGEKLSVRAKKVIIPAIMGWVLKRAHGIKLLFDAQIDPFAEKVKGKVIGRFPCHVSTSSFKPLREDKEVLFVGFPFKRKGVDVLIAAFKQISDKHPDWKLKILGWFPDPTELNAAIAGHPRIYHHLPVYFPEMPGHVGSCGILVLPSRSEAMGRILVEAMACAKPRIGSNVDGIPTVIEDEVDGLLVPPENADALAAALDRLMSDASLRQKLGQAGLTRSQSEFSEEAHFLNTMKFYAKVLS